MVQALKVTRTSVPDPATRLRRRDRRQPDASALMSISRLQSLRPWFTSACHPREPGPPGLHQYRANSQAAAPPTTPTMMF